MFEAKHVAGLFVLGILILYLCGPCGRDLLGEREKKKE